MSSPFKLPRNYGPCIMCGRPRKRKVSDLCPKCNRTGAARKRKAESRARALRRAAQTEEQRLTAMENAPLRRVRTPEYVYLEAASVTASAERAELLSPGVASWWRRWLENPDNPCSVEALDAAGW